METHLFAQPIKEKVFFKINNAIFDDKFNIE